MATCSLHRWYNTKRKQKIKTKTRSKYTYKEHLQMTICTVCTTVTLQTFSSCLYTIRKKYLIAAKYLILVSHALNMHSLLHVVYTLRYYTFSFKNLIGYNYFSGRGLQTRELRLHLPPPWSLPDSPRIHFQGVEDHDQCREATECELLLSTKLTSQREVTVHVP